MDFVIVERILLLVIGGRMYFSFNFFPTSSEIPVAMLTRTFSSIFDNLRSNVALSMNGKINALFT